MTKNLKFRLKNKLKKQLFYWNSKAAQEKFSVVEISRRLAHFKDELANLDSEY